MENKFCGSCGTGLRVKGAGFCVKCGTDPGVPEGFCIACGKRQKGIKFIACSGCGADFKAEKDAENRLVLALVVSFLCMLLAVVLPATALVISAAWGYLTIGNKRKWLLYQFLSALILILFLAAVVVLAFLGIGTIAAYPNTGFFALIWLLLFSPFLFLGAWVLISLILFAFQAIVMLDVYKEARGEKPILP